MRDLHTLDQFRMRADELRIYGSPGDGGNGIFKIHVNGRSFFVVATSKGGWDHVSVSPVSRKHRTCPTWDEMCAVKDLFFEPEERVVQFHPPQSEYVNRHPHCLHLWRPTAEELPHPPIDFV